MVDENEAPEVPEEEVAAPVEASEVAKVDTETVEENLEEAKSE